jgi:hypothetical protein
MIVTISYQLGVNKNLLRTYYLYKYYIIKSTGLSPKKISNVKKKEKTVCSSPISKMASMVDKRYN